jgi:hypothetical protein
MSGDVRSINHALRDAAGRLVAERSDLPPGAVLRSFYESVRTVLLRGYELAEVPAAAERLARQELDLCPLGGQLHRRAEPPRVPRARRVV